MPLLNYLEEVNQCWVMNGPLNLGNGSVMYDFEMIGMHAPFFNFSLICGISLLATGISYTGLNFHTVRLPLHDIESVTLIVNDQPIETVVNYSRSEESVSGVLPAQYNVPILFNNGMPLNSIYGQIKIRIIFWRQPISSFMIGVNPA